MRFAKKAAHRRRQKGTTLCQCSQKRPEPQWPAQLSQSGNNGGLHGPNGSNRDGVTITPKPDSVHTPLNLIPDSPDAAPIPPPADLTLLSGPTTEPARKPLRDASMGGQYTRPGLQDTREFSSHDRRPNPPACQRRRSSANPHASEEAGDMISSDNLRSHAVRLRTWGWPVAIDAACAALNQAADYIDGLETTVRDAHALLAPALTVDAPASAEAPAAADTDTTA